MLRHFVKKEVYFEKEDLHSDEQIEEAPATNYLLSFFFL